VLVPRGARPIVVQVGLGDQVCACVQE
jgi:hypothetical protein